MKDLKTRVISGIIGLLLLILVVKLGNPILGLVVTAFSLVGLGELFRAFENKGLKPLKLSAGLLVLVGYILGNYSDWLDQSFYLKLFITAIAMYFLLVLLTQKYRIEDVGVTILGLAYVPNLFSYLIKLAGSPYIWLVFIIAFGTDTFAYFAGNLFGKNKLCPSISPNKTVEGFLGGIVGSIILTMIYVYILGLGQFYSFIPLAIIASILSQTGDLVASVIKRYTGIKDYGKLIPGHGGILDRFDSVIFTSPIVFYYVSLIIK